MSAPIVLASKSTYRATLLSNAGITFSAEASDIDERAIEAPLLEAEMGGADIAEVLAVAKASDVSSKHSDAWVIGSDQTLSFNGKLLHKPENMEEARRRLLLLSGKPIISILQLRLFETKRSCGLIMKLPRSSSEPLIQDLWAAISPMLVKLHLRALVPIRLKAKGCNCLRPSRVIFSQSWACPCCPCCPACEN